MPESFWHPSSIFRYNMVSWGEEVLERSVMSDKNVKIPNDNEWLICGCKLLAGEKKQLYLEVGGEDYRVPVTFICGSKPGKTVLITAGIHSGEYPGIPAAIRIAKEIEPERLTGNLLIMHCVNVSGFWKKSISLIPEDGFNLNGDYPGRDGGTVGEQIADYFVQKIFPNIDFVLDLHSGAFMEPLTPCLFFPKAKKVREQSLEAARALNIPYLIESTAQKGEYSYAANFFDIPGLLLERGDCGQCQEEWIEAYRQDILLLLKHLKMYDSGMVQRKLDKKIFDKTIYLSANTAGVWYPAVKLEQEVYKGELLGHMEDFFGNISEKYFAEADGIVFYYTGGLAVNEGDALVAYGISYKVEKV